MKGKIMLLTGGAVGYVLGTAAGRERYEQIKTQATSLWNNPKVQEKATQAQDLAAQAQDLAKEKAPIVKDKAVDAASSASSAAKDKVGGSKKKDSDISDSDIAVDSLSTTDTAVVVDVVEPAPYPPSGI